jgi:phage baseplate assembly protein gpV
MANPNNNQAQEIPRAMNPDMSLYGLYLGKVEFNKDPMQMGRVMVRIPSFDGPPDLIRTNQLQWATMATGAFGGGPGYGSFTIPPVGSMVMIMFNGGDPDFPVVIGPATIAPTKERDMLRDSNREYPSGTVSMSSDKNSPWQGPPVNEAPTESLLMVDNVPEVYTVFKSPKGASFVIQDRDEVEDLKITDRAGQSFTMSAPVERKENQGNARQRGLQSAAGGDSVPAEALKERVGHITLVDMGGQAIELYTKQNADESSTEGVKNYHGKIRISSRQPVTVTKGLTKETRSGNNESDGENGVVLEMSGSDGKLTIEMQNDNTINTIIHIDSKAGTISFQTPLQIKLKSDSIKLDGDVQITGSLIVDGKQINNDNLIVTGEILNNPSDVIEFTGNSNPSI